MTARKTTKSVPNYPRVMERQQCGVLALLPTLALVSSVRLMSNISLCLSDAQVVDLACAWTAHWDCRTQVTNALAVAKARASMKGEKQCGGKFTRPTRTMAPTPRHPPSHRIPAKPSSLMERSYQLKRRPMIWSSKHNVWVCEFLTSVMRNRVHASLPARGQAHVRKMRTGHKRAVRQ